MYQKKYVLHNLAGSSRSSGYFLIVVSAVDLCCTISMLCRECNIFSRIMCITAYKWRINECPGPVLSQSHGVTFHKLTVYKLYVEIFDNVFYTLKSHAYNY